MTQQDMQEKRDSIDLLAGMADEQTRQAIIRTFQGQLTEYVIALLSEENDDARALWIRAKAMGLIETLDAMGLKIASVQGIAPLRKAADAIVRQSLLRQS